MVEPGKFKVKSRSTKLLSERKYLENIENLWKDFKKLFDKKLELDSAFSFKKMASEIYTLREGKGIAASTLKNFYLRKTNPRKITVEAIQEWINREKERGEEDVDSINDTV